jgi:hypothetical protein
MRQLIECGKNKLDDPILTWALRRYQHAQLRGSDLCRSMEEAWFHDLALRRWIDSSDHTLLEELLRILPHWCPNVNRIDSIGYRALARMFARECPERGLEG